MTEWLPKAVPGLTVRIDSAAGVSTCVDVRFGKKLHVLFDVGVCKPAAAGANHVFISHAHLDHIGGVFTHARLRSHQGRPATYYVPENCKDDFVKAREGFEGMNSVERSPFLMTVNFVKPGDVFQLGNDFRVTVIKTVHRVPSIGFEVSQQVRGLLPEFQHLSGQEKGKLAREGVSLTSSRWESQLAYTGDTMIEGVMNNPEFLNAKLLITEMTFLGSGGTKDTVLNSRSLGHMHLNELVENSETVIASRVQRIVLCHFSRRYSKQQIIESFKQVPNALADKIGLALNAFGGRDVALVDEFRSTWRPCAALVGKFRTEPDDTVKVASKPCRYYSNAGSCRFGDKCAFAHVNIKQRHAPSQNTQAVGASHAGVDQTQADNALHVGADQSVTNGVNGNGSEPVRMDLD